MSYLIDDPTNINPIQAKKYAEKYLARRQKEKVAIILATYNGEKYIKQQLDSLVSQKYRNWTLYVSDDHSTDYTYSILKQYKRKLGEKIILTKNTGNEHSAPANFSNALSLSEKSDYYMFMDQDDVWDENKVLYLVAAVKLAEQHTQNPILAYCDAQLVDKNLNLINPSYIHSNHLELPRKNLLNHSLTDNFFPGCLTIFNYKLRRLINPFDKTIGNHDAWLSVIAAFTGSTIFLDLPLHKYRQHNDSLVGGELADFWSMSHLLKVFKTYFIDKSIEAQSCQTRVLNRARELKNNYQSIAKPNKMVVVDQFIHIMEKPKFLRLIPLLIGSYTPSKTIRVIKLII